MLCSWYLGPVRPSSALSCPSCWNTAQVFSYHCLHAWCTTLAAYLSADTISYYCDGLPVCPSLWPHLPSWSLLPSFGCCSASGAPFCCEGWALGPSGTFSYYAAKGLFCCGPIGLEWSPCWAAFLADDLPFQILHLPSLAVTELGAPMSSRVLKRRYISLQNEWMNELLLLYSYFYYQ